ncbi:hypothetical protein [Kordiimonas aestuarii]|uniref:hypothetical protein n=1 Tax=Kordiimonas aestuarii TaxID=1005925 RepID=UPI0021D0C3D2|nr:hypothetical protein [Kordiimonas aestuarii]
MDNLSTIRSEVVKILLSFLSAHIPAAFVYGWSAKSENTLMVAAAITLFAILATLIVLIAPEERENAVGEAERARKAGDHEEQAAMEGRAAAALAGNKAGR